MAANVVTATVILLSIADLPALAHVNVYAVTATICQDSGTVTVVQLAEKYIQSLW